MRVAVLFPTRTEAEFFVPPTGCEVVICGVGMAECGASVARVVAQSHPDLVILAGVAGSYTNRLNYGQTVAVRAESVADMGRVESWSEIGGERFTPLFRREYCATDLPRGFEAVVSNTVNGCGVPYASLTEADVENMEGAAFFATTAALGVRSMQVRTISNVVGERFDIEDVRECARGLAEALTEILKQLTADETFA